MTGSITPLPTTEVVVRRHWNDWQTAVYPLAATSGWHWSDISGGVHVPSPRPFVHAYVSCDAALRGEVAHSCLHGEGPHRIKVCLVKKDNTRAVVAWATARADKDGSR